MLEAGFLDGGRGALFYVLYRPAPGTARRGAVLHVHPFAEELNKSRRMIALQARRLAEHGFVVLVLDQFGCGDSAGDFGDATWEGWLEDLQTGLAQLGAEAPGAPVLWGLRSGCLLIDALVARHGVRPKAQIYWQPVLSGELFLNQFLRLRLAAEMMGGGPTETTGSLRQRLAAGESLEVAGYTLSAQLAGALVHARLSQPPSAPLCWVEVVIGPEAQLSPASRKRLDDWQAQGCRIEAAAVVGEPFWATQEIREVPALLERTTQFVLTL